MDRKSTLGPAFASLLLATMLLLSLSSPGAGQTAPDFRLKDVIQGREYTLSQFRGQVVLVNFFTYFCKPCREEMPFINQIDQELKSRGFQTIGIGLESTPEELRSLAQQLGLGYPVLEGTEQVAKAFGNVEFVPTTFIIDRQGRIAQKIFEARSKEDLLRLIKPLL